MIYVLPGSKMPLNCFIGLCYFVNRWMAVAGEFGVSNLVVDVCGLDCGLIESYLPVIFLLYNYITIYMFSYQ